MTFTVTYRAKDGALREERIEAANRAECVAECRRRGIAPTKIAEGQSGKSAASPKGRDGARPSHANGQDARSPSQRAGRPLSQWLIAVVLIAAVAGGVWWWVGGRGATALPAEVPAKPKVEKPKTEKPKAKTPAPKPAATPAPRPAPFKAKTKPEKTAEVEPPEIAQERILAHYSAINPKLVRDHELFKHDSDIMIADVITARPGERLIDLELDRDFDRKFAESLSEPIAPHEKDTDEDRRVKDAVTLTRQILAERMAAGESPAKVIQEARRDLNKIADYRDLLESELHKLADTEDEAYLDSFVAEANKLLDEYGAFHLKVGKRMRAKVRERTGAQGAPETQGAAGAAEVPAEVK